MKGKIFQPPVFKTNFHLSLFYLFEDVAHLSRNLFEQLDEVPTGIKKFTDDPPGMQALHFDPFDEGSGFFGHVQVRIQRHSHPFCCG